MSEHINGDGPQNLRNAMRVMRREIQRMEKVSHSRRKQGLIRGPRQYCSVCGKVFDFAIVDPNATLTAAICTDCKALLAEGYTAAITSNEYAFIRSDYLKEHGMSGKIVPMSDEAFKQLQAKFNVSREPNPEA